MVRANSRTSSQHPPWYMLILGAIRMIILIGILITVIVIAVRQDNNNNGHHHDDDNDIENGYTSNYRYYQNVYIGRAYRRYSNLTASNEGTPNARHISNEIMAYTTKVSISVSKRCAIMPNRYNLSSMATAFGQFIDHDISLTPTGRQYGIMTVDMSCDASADPDCSGKQFEIERSKYTLDKTGERRPVNDLSPFLTLSVIYGSDAVRASTLREYWKGRLKTSNSGRHLPRNIYGLQNAGGNSNKKLYLAGDIRANENAALLALQTLFVLNHNYWAEKLYHKYGRQWTDEQLYWTARRMVTAEVQTIVYNEFLPAIVGSMPEARHDSKADPRLYNEFSTAAYRIGHTLVGESLYMYDRKKTGVSCFPMAASFFNVSVFETFGMDAILGGLLHQPAEELDVKIVPALRNGLHFGEIFDLATLNLMRGKDNGLPYYHHLREAVTGQKITGWHDICKDEDLLYKMKKLYGYEDGWKKLDAWLGILAEDAIEGSMLGPTGTFIIRHQFDTIRSADDYYPDWDDELSPKLKAKLQKTTLYDILLRNTGLKQKDLPKNRDVFHVYYYY